MGGSVSFSGIFGYLACALGAVTTSVGSLFVGFFNSTIGVSLSGFIGVFGLFMCNGVGNCLLCGDLVCLQDIPLGFHGVGNDLGGVREGLGVIVFLLGIVGLLVFLHSIILGSISFS